MDITSETKKRTIPTGIQWDVQRFNGYPFFLSSAAMLSGFKLPWGLFYTHFLCISHSKNVEWHYDSADYERIGLIFWKKIKTIEDLNSLIRQYRRNYRKFSKAAKYKESDLNKLPVDKLIALLKKRISCMESSGGLAHIIECATFVGERLLKIKYPKNTPEVHASEMSFLKRAEIHALKLLNSKKGEIRILSDFNDRFAWIQSSYLGRNELSFKDIKSLARHVVCGEIKDSKSTISDDKFVNMLSHIFSWQDERKGNLLESIYYSEPVLLALARKVGISVSAAKFILPEELDKVTDKAYQRELTKRARLVVDYAPHTMKRVVLVGSEAEDFVKDFTTAHNDTSIIKGSVAFKGNIKGVVRVCLSLPSIQSFVEGEILVASMTRPEYIPAMKKAAAFVTDEGGITCHAAIIAREMRKPCIIGTKIATKVLKDGDLVEVDAERGIVKILSHE